MLVTVIYCSSSQLRNKYYKKHDMNYQMLSIKGVLCLKYLFTEIILNIILCLIYEQMKLKKIIISRDKITHVVRFLLSSCY